MIKNNAPAVTYPIRCSRLHALVLWGFWLSGALCSLLWVYSVQVLGWRSVISVVSVLVAGLFLHRYGRSLGGGDLAWDGSNWKWERKEADPQAVAADQSIFVVADLQKFMLLALTDNAGNRHWLFAQKSVLPERWLDFRRAVYCQRKSSVPPVQIDSDGHAEALPVAVLSHDQTKNRTRIGA